MNQNDVIQNIKNDLLKSGIREGGVVLMHSSLKSLGYVPKGPETFIKGVLAAIGEKGTLLVPSLSYIHVDETNPVFDLLNTPSDVGAVSEYFRKMPGTIRSINPTHSVCGIGALAEEILKNHSKDETPCGENSPFRILKEYDGQILFVGCSLEPNTSMHGVEEIVEPPYLFKETIDYKIILPDGRCKHIKNRRHNFEGYKQRYDRVESILDDNGLKKGKVLEADTFIIESSVLWKEAVAQLRQDPLFFVESM